MTKDNLRNPGPMAYTQLATLSGIAGSIYLFNAIALRGFTPAEIVVSKLLIGATLLFVVQWVGAGLRPMTSKQLGWCFLLGLVGYTMPQFTMAWAQRFVDSSVAGLFLATMPLFSLLMARVILGERYGPVKWLGFAIGLAGLVIMTNPVELIANHGTTETVGPWPYLALVVTCLFFSTSSIMVQTMPPLPTLQVTSIALFSGSLFLAPVGLGGFLQTVGVQLKGGGSLEEFMPLIAVVTMGVVLSGLGQAMRTSLIRRYGTVFFSAVGYMVPVWALVFGVVFLGEELTTRNMIAFGVITVGLLLAQSKRAGRFGGRVSAALPVRTPEQERPASCK